MSDSFNLSKPNRPIHVGVILTNGVTEGLDVAPIHFFHGVAKDSLAELPDLMVAPKIKEQGLDVIYHWVSDTGGVRMLSCGSQMQTTDTFETCPKLDVVMIGAHNGNYTPNEAELAFARKSYEECSAFITICGGNQVPLAAGILSGKTCTAPRLALDYYRKQAPDVNWLEKRWVRDGKLWTSSTLLNGLDLMYNFMFETFGKPELGDDCMVKFVSKLGYWPNRDVDFKDVDYSWP